MLRLRRWWHRSFHETVVFSQASVHETIVAVKRCDARPQDFIQAGFNGPRLDHEAFRAKSASESADQTVALIIQITRRNEQGQS